MVIMQNDVNSGFSKIWNLSNSQDVATVLDTYEDAARQYPGKNIVDMLEDNDRMYYAVVNLKEAGSFDLFSFINSRYSGNEVINCMNARLLFPKYLSRGVSSVRQNAHVDARIQQNSEFLDDTPTGFVDESEMPKLSGIGGSIFYRKLGISCDIPASGLVLGRSAKKSDFLIRNNSDVSRAHCRVYEKGDKFYLQDLNSLNGTFLNGVRVRPEQDVLLNAGDIILIAGEEIEVQ